MTRVMLLALLPKMIFDAIWIHNLEKKSPIPMKDKFTKPKPLFFSLLIGSPHHPIFFFLTHVLNRLLNITCDSK